jgi:phytoene synthase
MTAPSQAAQRASGSSFYRGMRILPRAEREAMFEIYSFCRAVDDIADDPGERDVRTAQLAQWRRDIDAIYAGTPPARLAGLAAAVRQFGMAREDFLAVIDGMEMDVLADIRAPDLATLDLYCDRVASAVGRLSVKVFGLDARSGLDLAHHLGRALQLTNILRDLAEDAERGRLYLPKELLEQHGVPCGEPKTVLAHPKLRKVCRDVASLALDHFAKARAAMDRCAKRPMRPAAIMGAVYRAILQRLVKADWKQLDQPVKLPKWQKLWLAFRYGFL